MLILVDFFLNLDTRVAALVAAYGAWTYAILFFIIFVETGVVIMPFLPGDSLIFVAGTFAANGSLDPWALFALLSVAAVSGDAANYWIGHLVGPRVFAHEDHWFFRRKHLERTQAFYDKYGPKTIVLARYVPIVRTFAPFVAGIAGMPYRSFALYNILGGVTWVGLAVWAGYFFGNIPWVKENFEIVLVGVVVVSFLPPIVEWAREKRKGRRAR